MENNLELKIVYKLVSEKKYDFALFELKKIEMENEVGSDENFHYLSALVNTKLGNITLARHHLMSIENQTKIVRAYELNKKLQDIEPMYILLTAKFNKSIDLLREKDFVNANEMLQDIFSQSFLFPFPLQWYKTFYLVKLRIKAEDLEIWVNQLPTHIRNNQDMVRIMEATTPKESINRIVKNKKKRFIPWFVFGGSTAAIAVSIVLSLSLFQLDDFKGTSGKIETQENIVPEEDKPVHKVSVETGELAKEEKNEENRELTSTYPELTDITAKAFYTEGYQQYQKGNFSDAVLNFTPVTTDTKKEYYTDDSHYFLILSLFEVGNFDECLKQSQNFIEEQDDHYKSSPYLDAVHLKYAEALMEIEEVSEAILELENLIEKGHEGWAVNKASNMLKGINNGN